VRSLVVHFSGGTEVSIRVGQEPEVILGKLEEDGAWLVVEDQDGSLHYLSKGQIAYLTFTGRRDIGFA